MKERDREAVCPRERAGRLTAVFQRLFWASMAGLALTVFVTLFGDWEAHPGWSVGLAGFGQAWMAGAALLAFRVYARAEALEMHAARAASAPADDPEMAGPNG